MKFKFLKNFSARFGNLVLTFLVVLTACEHKSDDTLPELKLADYYTLERSNPVVYEYNDHDPFIQVDKNNLAFLCYQSATGMKGFTVDTDGDCINLNFNGETGEYFQNMFFSAQNTPVFCTNKRILMHDESGFESIFPGNANDDDLLMACMNTSNESLWLSKCDGIYSKPEEADFTLIKSHQELFPEKYNDFQPGYHDSHKKMCWENDVLYYLLSGELWIWQHDAWQRMNDAVDEDCYVADFSLDSNGRLWIAVVGYSGIIRLNGTNKKLYPFPPLTRLESQEICDPAYNQQSIVSVRDLELDKDDQIWIVYKEEKCGNTSGGILMFSGDAWYNLSSPTEDAVFNSLSLSVVFDLAISSDNQVLFVTERLDMGRISEK
ncbi:MAG: hypothetical protein JXB49_04740 [Bacteroidales bacterium]|nr:hypothetical protein [Bacteroidales bacterium]